MSSNFSLSGASICEARARIKRMGGVDFEHRLRCRSQPPARRQHPFKSAVRPALGRDETRRARRQPVGSPDILDRFAQDLFHKRVKGGETCRGRLGRAALSLGIFLLERNGFDVGGALGHGFERLSVKTNRRRDPERIHMIRQKQDLDSSGAKPFELGAGGKPGEILAKEIIDRRLIGLQTFDVRLEVRPPSGEVEVAKRANSNKASLRSGSS